MAPKNVDSDSQPHFIDRTPEYEDFIHKLSEYHKQRGTNLDPEPKIGSCHIDLFKLFNHVVENNGYDKISAEKLAWRRMTEELRIPAGNIAQTSFQVKSCFYRYLAAYEIKTVYKKEPPPKELLEDQSAKGGSLLTRTWENNPFKNAPGNPDAATDPSGDDSTPARDRPTNPNPSSARASRGLREAPPQRVLFQPDTGPTRSSRHASGHHHSSNLHHPSGGAISQTSASSVATASAPTSATAAHAGHGNSQQSATVSLAHHQASGNNNTATTSHPSQSVVAQSAAIHHHPSGPHQLPRGVSASYQPQIPDNISSAVTVYEPRQPIIVPIMPVSTPSNNPNRFMKRKRNAHPRSTQPDLIYKHDGPNIYMRCLFALRSGIPAEQAFALTHLVRISFERGDKYKFESFLGLAEGLIEKALEVGRIFYHGIDWKISFSQTESENDISTLDGFNGTRDVLERIDCLTRKPMLDDVLPAAEQDLLTHITEAILTIRNMVLLPENAAFMASHISLRDLLCIVLNLPSLEMLVEIKHYALDIAEYITPFLALDTEDPMYMSIVSQLGSTDRGMILTALRALARISMNIEASNQLGNIPAQTLRDITNWMLLNDEDLVDACLDFFYQYTAVVSNVEFLLTAISPETLVGHLVRLLAHGAKRVSYGVVLEPAQVQPASSKVADMPLDLVKRLLKIDEPTRCQTWLRGFFEEDPNSVITQMTVWQAYQAPFIQPVNLHGRKMISPSEFIKFVNHVFPSAHAQIVEEPTGNKFVICGMRPRPYPLGPDGRMYYPCKWMMATTQKPCGESFSHAEDMYNHILTTHILPKKAELATCLWHGCTRFKTAPATSTRELALHVKVHAAYRPPALDNKVSSKSYITPAKTMSIQQEQTSVMLDERGVHQAAGVPLSAALVLCNLARNVVKTKADQEMMQAQRAMGGPEQGGWNERLFRPVLPRLHQVMDDNLPMSSYISRLIVLADPPRE